MIDIDQEAFVVYRFKEPELNEIVRVFRIA